MIFHCNKRQLPSVLALAAGLACNMSIAQSTGTPPNAGTVLQTVPPPASGRSADVPSLDKSRVQGKAPSASTGPKVLVKGFRLTGNTSLPSEALMSGLKPFENRELTIGELEEAAETVRDQYRNAGFFLAQALIPTQDVSSGIVQINILEGKVGQTIPKMAPSARVSEALVKRYLSILPAGSPLTEQTVERPLLLLSDLAGVKVYSVLKPGAEVGTANLEVAVSSEGNWYGGSVYLDNYGNRDTGKVRLGVNLESRGLFGIGEVVNASLIKASNLTTVGGLGATLPVGDLGTKVSLGFTNLAYDVGGAYASLGATGDGVVITSLVQHPLVRSRNTNVLLLGGVDYKRVRDTPSSAAIANERRIATVRVGVGGDFRDNVGGGSLNSYTFSLSQGQNKIVDAQNFAVDQSEGGFKTSGNFTKLQFEYLRLQSLASVIPGLTDADSLYVSLRGQLSLNKNLDNIEKLSLGGPRGVRAYPVGAASSDDAVVLTTEFRHRFGESYKLLGGNFLVTAFVDYGKAKLAHRALAFQAADNSVALGAVGVGVHLVKKDDFDVRVDIARRAGSTGYISNDTKATQVWALLQKWF